MKGNFYRPQTTFAKVMCLHLSVILFTGGVSQHAMGQTPRQEDTRKTPPQEDTKKTPPQEDRPPKEDTRKPTQEDRPPGADTPLPKQTATAADGTHPTGMHSCCTLWLVYWTKIKWKIYVKFLLIKVWKEWNLFRWSKMLIPNSCHLMNIYCLCRIKQWIKFQVLPCTQDHQHHISIFVLLSNEKYTHKI